MDPDDGMEDEGPFSAWLPPDDRLWRHPSEIGGGHPSDLNPTHDFDALTNLVGAEADLTQDFDAHLRAAHGAVSTLIRSGPIRTWTVAVVAGVVGALLASGVTMATGNFGSRPTVLQTASSVTAPDTVTLVSPSAPAPVATAPNWASVASAVAASVVGVLASSGASGSGVLYTEGSGHSYIITTNDLATKHVEVTFDDGTQQVARLVAADAPSGLAILSVTGEKQAIPTFGSVSELRGAESLMSISGGLAQGVQYANLSVTSVDDAATISDEQTLVGMLAVTGPNSTQEGGALVDAHGHVVGITTSMTSTNPMQEGTSYAIPINLAVHVANQMLSRQRVTHPYVGVIQSQDLSSVTARGYGIQGGATVQTVAPGSPAAAAGITPGDVITAMGAMQVSSAGGLISALCHFEPGASMTVRYLHQGKPAAATIRVSEQPGNIPDPNSY